MKTASAALERPGLKEHPTDRTRSESGWKSILFNCNCHSFVDVAVQLMKAIHCTYERGMQLANVVHHTGSAIVYSGLRERCEHIVAVLQEIGLVARVEQ